MVHRPSHLILLCHAVVEQTLSSSRHFLFPLAFLVQRALQPRFYFTRNTRDSRSLNTSVASTPRAKTRQNARQFFNVRQRGCGGAAHFCIPAGETWTVRLYDTAYTTHTPPTAQNTTARGMVRLVRVSRAASRSRSALLLRDTPIACNAHH